MAFGGPAQVRGAWSRWRWAMWGGAAALLMAPAVAMVFTDEVDWGPGDFIVFGAMLMLAAGGVEAAVRLLRRRGPRLLAVGVVLAVFVLVWAQLAVDLTG